MVKLRTLKHILSSAWIDEENIDIDKNFVPIIWKNHRKPSKYEIDLWEQIYFVPGVIGLYAAYHPYVDFYLITYNLFLDDRYIEEFYGPHSVADIQHTFMDLNIILPSKISSV